MTDHWDESMRRRYTCRRLAAPLDLFADEEDAGWQALPWSEPFADITGLDELEPVFRTRMRMGWDDRYLYVNAEMEEPHVWGTISERNACRVEDNEVESCIDPDCDGLNYYEVEINALCIIGERSLPNPYGEGGEPLLAEPACGTRRRVALEEGERDGRIDVGEDGGGPGPEALEQRAELVREGYARGDQVVSRPDEGAERPDLVRQRTQRSKTVLETTAERTARDVLLPIFVLYLRTYCRRQLCERVGWLHLEFV